MRLAQGPQRSYASEARTRGPSVSSQALYDLATGLPYFIVKVPTFPCPSVLTFVLVLRITISRRDRFEYQQPGLVLGYYSLVSQLNHMLWVLKRTVSMRRFF